MTLPTIPVIYPKDLANESNGELSGTLLTLCGIGNFKMHHLASRALRALMAAYEPLTESCSGTYRTYAEQAHLFDGTDPQYWAPGNNYGRYIPQSKWTAYTAKGYKFGTSIKAWNGQQWKIRANCALAAIPGTSNHGWALAIDFNTDMVGYYEFVNWLIVNAITYGYSAEAQSEPWHWRYVAGDNLPQAVLNFENGEDDMMEKIQVPGDAAIFIRDGGNCTWASDTAVTLAWEAEGLIQPAGVVRSVPRTFLKGLTFYGKVLPNNNVTVESDFGLWIKS